jgi:hypothetical protein
LIAAVVIPALVLGGLFLLPFFDIDLASVGVYFRSWRGRYLSLMALGLSLVSVPTWVLLDEYLLKWNERLPGWPTLLSTGLIPLAVLLLGLIGLDEFIQHIFQADREERILFLFIFLLMALVVLTAIGIFFRGAGMALIWPWELATASH